MGKTEYLESMKLRGIDYTELEGRQKKTFNPDQLFQTKLKDCATSDFQRGPQAHLVHLREALFMQNSM